MLKISGVLTLTLREHLRGQLLWTTGFVSVLLLLLVALLSGSALTHENRVLDVFSYYINDQVLLFIAIFSGAAIFTQDFSARGIAELLIPSGYPRHLILLVRMLGFVIVLCMLALFIFAIKSFLLPLLTDFPQAGNHRAHMFMLLLSLLKSIAGLTVATLLGCLARPIFAVLATITLFSVGHITASFDSLIHSANNSVPMEELGFLSASFYKIFSFWDPGILVLESVRGQWVIPDSQSLLAAGVWAAGVILFSGGLAMLSVSRADIKP